MRLTGEVNTVDFSDLSLNVDPFKDLSVLFLMSSSLIDEIYLSIED